MNISQVFLLFVGLLNFILLLSLLCLVGHALLACQLQPEAQKQKQSEERERERENLKENKRTNKESLEYKSDFYC